MSLPFVFVAMVGGESSENKVLEVISNFCCVLTMIETSVIQTTPAIWTYC